MTDKLNKEEIKDMTINKEEIEDNNEKLTIQELLELLVDGGFAHLRLAFDMAVKKLEKQYVYKEKNFNREIWQAIIDKGFSRKELIHNIDAAYWVHRLPF